jgi:hypothetical protein
MEHLFRSGIEPTSDFNGGEHLRGRGPWLRQYSGPLDVRSEMKWYYTNIKHALAITTYHEERCEVLVLFDDGEQEVRRAQGTYLTCEETSLAVGLPKYYAGYRPSEN